VTGLFVTGTDTGVGKTILSAALLAAMAAEGERVCAYKPVLTGLDEQTGSPQPRDDELLALVAGMPPEKVAPLRYHPAASPHLAAELVGERIDPAQLLERIPSAEASGAPRSPARADEEGCATEDRCRRGSDSPILVVEGIGGLLVPLDGDYTVRELALALGLPLLIAARSTLGTINHTLLTLQAARAAGLNVVAVVLTPWPERPSEFECSNRETIIRLGAVEVQGLRRVRTADTRELANAGATLPWRRWLGRPQTPDPARAASTMASVTLASSS
jgi:dethiobiotin synthetase